MNKYLILGVVAILVILGGWWYFNQSIAPKTSETTYAVEHDQLKNLCAGNIPQRLVRATLNRDGVWATTTVSADIVPSLKTAGVQTDSKQEWHVLSTSARGDNVFLYASSPCAEKMTMYGPSASLNLSTMTFKELTTPFREFHWLEPYVVSPDGTKIAAVIIGYPSDGVGTLRVIDLIEDTFSVLATAPEGTQLASWCENYGCANYLLRWIDADTIEYGVYEPGYTEESKTPKEVRRVNLP